MFCSTLCNKIGNKKVVIYGAGIIGTEALNVILSLNIDVLYFLDKNEKKQEQSFFGYEVKAPKEIIAETQDTIIILALHQIKEAQLLLEGLGLKENIDFIVWEFWIQGDNIASENTKHNIHQFQTVLQYGKQYPSIALYGNSTIVSGFYEIKSWPEFLAELLIRDGIKVNIYNGAIVGYSSSDEVLKFVRDGIGLYPEIVISYSGIIDFAKPDSFSGDIACNWQKNERIMRSVCNEFGIAFMGILQPSIYTRNIDFYDLRSENEIRSWFGCKKTVNERIENLYQEAIKLIQDEEQLYDMTGMFDRETDIYIGRVHTNEKGNRIIAKRIYELLMNNYQQWILS